jgi:CheY-like chemotaxis protein
MKKLVSRERFPESARINARMNRILVVDDEEGVRQWLDKVLEQAGYAVVTAADGAEALRLCREQPADLVIIDLFMPEKEGLETIKELRQMRQDQKVIAISGGGRLVEGDYLALARNLGATRTLSKPFSAEEILHAIAELLGTS